MAANLTFSSSPSWVSKSPPYTSIISTIVIIALVTWIVRVYQWRRSFLKLHGPYLKSPPFSMLWGTLGGYIDIVSKSPPDAHPSTHCATLRNKNDLGPIFFLDNWPAINVVQMVVCDPDVASQVTTETTYKKDPMVRKILSSICGPTSMFYAEDENFKYIRSLFGPGFAMSHLLTLVSMMIDDSQILLQRLDAHADKGDLFPIEPLIADYTLDIIGHIVLDHSFNTQTAENEFVMTYRKAVKWMTKITNVTPFQHPLKPVMQWYYRRVMDRYIKRVITERYQSNSTAEATLSSSKRGKPAIDLALDEYRAQQQAKGIKEVSSEPDAVFVQFVADQLKTFIMAGHETTSSGASYVFYLLSLNPEKLGTLRKELDAVFGSDVEATADKMRAQPHLLNQLPYTTAVIKETLRLFPLAGTSRAGAGPVILNNHTYPTHNLSIWINNYAIMHRPDLFPSPESFIPERFLPAPHNYQDVHKDAYRPFERGPRACFGQELAMLELRLIVVLMLRNFEVKECYREWDAKLGREKPGETLEGRRGMGGYRGYMQITVGGYPCDGMPVRISKRKRGDGC